ncbi:uncharacterized protein LOC119178667 isoform X2 [Rhipicephalus microplus]|uniref:uncharacterized protein LOC119178667 isoform X2 n=1 Tax=Rhipicephalus microplus TaxID=6941 RepID=UPI003F6AB882
MVDPVVCNNWMLVCHVDSHDQLTFHSQERLGFARIARLTDLTEAFTCCSLGQRSCITAATIGHGNVFLEPSPTRMCSTYIAAQLDDATKSEHFEGTGHVFLQITDVQLKPQFRFNAQLKGTVTKEN